MFTSQGSMPGLVTCFEALGLDKIRRSLQLSGLCVGHLLARERNNGCRTHKGVVSDRSWIEKPAH